MTDRVTLRAFAVFMARDKAENVQALIKDAKVIENYVAGDSDLPERAEDANKEWHKGMLDMLEKTLPTKDTYKSEDGSEKKIE